MIETLVLAKAELQEIDGRGNTVGKPVKVQFNPDTLKVSFSNQVVPPKNAGGNAEPKDARGNASIQFTSTGTTKLSVQLWFDVTADPSLGSDVQALTGQVIYFMTPKASPGNSNNPVPPGVRFRWGTFQFDGVMDGVEEGLEFFSPQGVPLRAMLSISMSKQEIIQTRRPDSAGSLAASLGLGGAGTQPLLQASAGASLQGIVAGAGVSTDWKAVAEVNGIENPRLLAPGQLINLNVQVGR